MKGNIPLYSYRGYFFSSHFFGLAHIESQKWIGLGILDEIVRKFLIIEGQATGY
tara:strand:+ start:31206 stop:31367 length:162 start_codon:yes stop_codon:yes gene_type:complete